MDISSGAFWILIGMRLSSYNDKSCELELRVRKKNLHAFNRAHGGVVASLIDSAIGFAAHNIVSAGFGTNTSQLNINYIKQVELGEIIRASAEIIHCGKTTMVGICQVRNQKGDKVAFGTATLITKPMDTLYKGKTKVIKGNIAQHTS